MKLEILILFINLIVLIAGGWLWLYSIHKKKKQVSFCIGWMFGNGGVCVSVAMIQYPLDILFFGGMGLFVIGSTAIITPLAFDW